MYPEFDSLTTTAGLEIIDPIESRRFTFRTSSVVEPTPAATGGFAFPVDTACEIRTASLALPYTVPVDVRTADGTHCDSINPTRNCEFPADEYLLDLHAPMKLYVRVESSLRIEADANDVRVEFGDETDVRVGARSYHSSPAGTITVPDDPEAAMEAVSAFPSALKTTSVERSWPTLRGHPPRVERGDRLAIPEELDVPDTGITVEVPPEYGPIYAVAPLAYYLGADVVRSSSAFLKADGAVTRHLGDDVTEIERRADALLKRVFLLDCVTRTEGYYRVDLHEREKFEPKVDLDFGALYDASPAERLAAYLSVPDDPVESITPTWHRVTHVQPAPSTVELLPYIVKDLSLVRVGTSTDETWTATEDKRETEDALQSFLRRTEPTDGLVRSANASTVRSRPGNEVRNFGRGVPGVGEYVPLPEEDALEQAYVGDKTPERGAKLLPEAFDNETPEQTEGVIEITTVCNDEEMRGEWDAVAEIYGDRDDVYIDVDCQFGVSTDDLRDLLAEDHDVFHFIGHIDGLGFACPDGILDAETIETTGATTALLNGCRSHDQGIALIEAGANAAIVSLGDVGNEGAMEVGETLARLLHHGFSVGSAMGIVREYTSIGRDYLVVGDPGVTVAQCESGNPTMYHVRNEDLDGDEIAVEYYAYPVMGFGIGAQNKSYLPQLDSYHVAIGKCGETTTFRDTLYSILLHHSEPLVVDGNLIWSNVWFAEN